MKIFSTLGEYVGTAKTLKKEEQVILKCVCTSPECAEELRGHMRVIGEYPLGTRNLPSFCNDCGYALFYERKTKKCEKKS